MGYLPYGKSSGQPAYNGEARTERGCVEDQPQQVGSSQASEACRVLRLVEDDTAALRPVVENLLSVIGDTTVGLAGIGAPITNNQFSITNFQYALPPGR